MHHSRITIVTVIAALSATMLGACSSDKATLSKQSTPTSATPISGATNTSTAGTSVSTQDQCRQPDQPTTVAYRVVANVNKNLTSLDVFPPANACKSPVVMWVHGGGYVRGDKANRMNDKIALFNRHGWILVSVNYRLSAALRRIGLGRVDGTEAKYPNHYDDVAASIAWVKNNIDRYGGDPTRIAILGHSAGADIVSNVVVNPKYLATYQVALHDVACAGVLDTEGLDKVAASAKDPDGEKNQWSAALGNDPSYLTDTSATLGVKAGIGIPKMIVVVRGTAQRQSIERAFISSLTAAKIPTATIVATPLRHVEVNTNIGLATDTVITKPLTSFLTGCFHH